MFRVMTSFYKYFVALLIEGVRIMKSCEIILGMSAVSVAQAHIPHELVRLKLGKKYFVKLKKTESLVLC